MNITTALTYWIIVALWVTIFGTTAYFYFANKQTFGTVRLLLAVMALDSLRNIIENIYFGMYFGSKYGLFAASYYHILGNPYLLILPKLTNILAGCIVLGLLLLRWLPEAIVERAESELRAKFLFEKATTDGMTGLLTRAEFLSLAEAEWRRCRRQKRPLSLVMIDIDHFKSINDDFGHSAGDQVIVRVTKLCREARRSSDIAGRLGGEEFVILLSETSVTDAAIFAERLRNIIASNTATETEGKIPATVSIGISDAEDTNSLAEVLKRADIALYEAKHNGRNRVHTYTAPTPQGECIS